jgi:hypothetical protein
MGKTIRKNDDRTFDSKAIKQIKKAREIRKEQNSNKTVLFSVKKK